MNGLNYGDNDLYMQELKMSKNYAIETENIIREMTKKNQVPSLLLHSCCAPCSSSVLEYLTSYFQVTVLYFNPNITDENEFQKRLEEQKRFIDDFTTKYPVKFWSGEYDVHRFLEFAVERKDEREGGQRCFQCYRLRMEEAARKGAENHFDFFTTTLTVSPLKNASKINEIGSILEGKYPIQFLYSDFKKKDGYKRSVELSKAYQLYRQNYCGCEFSK